MDTIFETSTREIETPDASDAQPAAPQTLVRQNFDGPATGQPRTEWIRCVCPLCGSPVVSNCYYVGGRGYLVVWECWESLRDVPACPFRHVL